MANQVFFVPTDSPAGHRKYLCRFTPASSLLQVKSAEQQRQGCIWTSFLFASTHPPERGVDGVWKRDCLLLKSPHTMTPKMEGRTSHPDPAPHRLRRRGEGETVPTSSHLDAAGSRVQAANFQPEKFSPQLFPRLGGKSADSVKMHPIEPQARHYIICRDYRMGGGTKSRCQRTATHAARKAAPSTRPDCDTPSCGDRWTQVRLREYCVVLTYNT